MTVQFASNRMFLFAGVFLLTATVLGISAYFASIFLPDLHHDFTIFSIVVSSLTILILLLTIQFAQPRTDAICFFILGACWLAMGAWATDIIGPIQCDALRGQRTATKNGDMNAQTYCYASKVIQAFSWMIFILYWAALAVLFSLVSQAIRLGFPDAWSRPSEELGWFGEWPGYYNQNQQMQMPPGMMQYPGMIPGTQPTPGQSIIIQPGAGGAGPTVHSVPFQG